MVRTGMLKDRFADIAVVRGDTVVRWDRCCFARRRERDIKQSCLYCKVAASVSTLVVLALSFKRNGSRCHDVDWKESMTKETCMTNFRISMLLSSLALFIVLMLKRRALASSKLTLHVLDFRQRPFERLILTSPRASRRCLFQAEMRRATRTRASLDGDAICVATVRRRYQPFPSAQHVETRQMLRSLPVTSLPPSVSPSV